MDYIFNTLKNNGIVKFLQFIWTNTNIHNISNVLSFINAICCVGFMYQYSKTKDIELFKKLAIYIGIPFLVIDLFITIYLIIIKSKKKTCYEIVFHHIITLLLVIWGCFMVIYNSPDVAYVVILFEASTIFLNLRYWIKEYIKSFEGNNIPIFIKISEQIIDVMFTMLFIYIRCFLFLKRIIFNKEFYNKLLANGLFINKLFIGIIFIFLLLNFYWSSIILKSLFKQLLPFIQNKYQVQDEELALIEKIHSEIIRNRTNN